MAIKKDCKSCGRRNVEGRLYRNDADKKLEAFEATIGTAAGFLVGGPIGAVVGGTLFHKGTKWLTKRDNTSSDGKVLYRFTCPACGEEWTDPCAGCGTPHLWSGSIGVGGNSEEIQVHD